LRKVDIYYQAWLPDGGVKAALMFVHGLGSHSGRYMNVVRHLVPEGIAVYGHDHIGHGRSGGARGRIRRFEDFTETIDTYHAMVRGWQAEKPIFLFGHSMGGLIATQYLIDHPLVFRGAILSAPALQIPEGISGAKLLASQVLARLAPQAGLLRLNPDHLSRDPEVVRSYRNDPLVFHGRTPARLVLELMKAMRRTGQGIGKLSLPLLIILGGGEKIVNPAGARMLFEKSGSQDKTLKIYEGLYHETFNEPERARVLDDMRTWLEAHM
jgi:acylglycerol lipase